MNLRPSPWRALALSLALVACRAAPPRVPDAVLGQARGVRGYVAGEVVAVSPWLQLNSRDFAYAVAFAPDGTRVAFSTMNARRFELALHEVSDEARRLALEELNPYEHDVEDLAFSADGRWVASVSRSGAVRLFDGQSGAALATAVTDEPLVSVVFAPAGDQLIVGSAHGLLTVLSAPGLAFESEVRAHKSEVRALATGGGLVFSGSWDRTIAVHEWVRVASQDDLATLALAKSDGQWAMRGTLEGGHGALFAVDQRVRGLAIHSDLARAAGLKVQPGLKVELVRPARNVTASVVPGVRVSFKGVSVTADAAVCDSCVPKGAQGVLGVLEGKLHVEVDEVTHTALVRRLKPEPGARSAAGLRERWRHAFPEVINDLTADARGERLGVALSDVRAERTRELYLREKRGQREPLREANAGAIVEARTGRVLRRWVLHRGIVSTAAISPDGQTLATGGWDNAVFVLAADGEAPIDRFGFGWSVRKLRYSPDGVALGAAAWTPQNALGNGQSDPSAVLFRMSYAQPRVEPRPPPPPGASR